MQFAHEVHAVAHRIANRLERRHAAREIGAKPQRVVEYPPRHFPREPRALRSLQRLRFRHLAQLDVGRGGKSLIDSRSALELTAWSVSDDHLQLRERLGLGLKGVR